MVVVVVAVDAAAEWLVVSNDGLIDTAVAVVDDGGLIGDVAVADLDGRIGGVAGVDGRVGDVADADLEVETFEENDVFFGWRRHAG